MVSFQCHACSDVVKKPKLDAHHGRCHSGFDCIDCHTTFNSPAEYKGHTSCITEAEKHQKSLYKGPKTGQDTSAPRNNYPKSAVSTTTYNPAGGNGGYGGYRNGSGRGRPQFQRNNATGANDTPLGTPARMSPVSTPPPTTVKAPSHAQINDTGKADEQRKEKKSKKQKKEKEKVLDAKEGDEKPEKKKKRKSLVLAESAEGEVKDPAETRSKDSKGVVEGDEVIITEAGQRDDKSKKRKRDDAESVDVEVPLKEKKKKKRKQDADLMDVDVPQQTDMDGKQKEKEKKKKSSKKDKETAPVDTPGAAAEKEKKSKKEDKYKREKEKRAKKAKAADVTA